MKYFSETMTRLTGQLAEKFGDPHKLEEEMKQRLGAMDYEF